MELTPISPADRYGCVAYSTPNFDAPKRFNALERCSFDARLVARPLLPNRVACRGSKYIMSAAIGLQPLVVAAVRVQRSERQRHCESRRRSRLGHGAVRMRTGPSNKGLKEMPAS